MVTVPVPPADLVCASEDQIDYVRNILNVRAAVHGFTVFDIIPFRSNLFHKKCTWLATYMLIDRDGRAINESDCERIRSLNPGRSVPKLFGKSFANGSGIIIMWQHAACDCNINSPFPNLASVHARKSKLKIAKKQKLHTNCTQSDLDQRYSYFFLSMPLIDFLLIAEIHLVDSKCVELPNGCETKVIFDEKVPEKMKVFEYAAAYADIPSKWKAEGFRDTSPTYNVNAYVDGCNMVINLFKDNKMNNNGENLNRECNENNMSGEICFVNYWWDESDSN